MLKLVSNEAPSFNQYEDNITSDKRVFFDTALLSRLIDYEASLEITCGRLAVETLSVEQNLRFGNLKKETILDYLKREVGESQFRLIDTKTKGYSLNKDNILAPLRQSGYAKEFLDNYIPYKEHQTSSNNMQKKMDRMVNLKPSDNCSNTNIKALTYEVERKATGRYYTKNDNIQNTGKIYSHAHTVPNDDYVLVWGDLDQIDLRVAYYTLISESKEDDIIFEKYDDKYEAFARIMDKKLDREFNLERFTDNRDKYKVGILARTYGLTIGELKKEVEDPEFAVMLNNYFLNNKRYMKYFDHITELFKKTDKEDSIVIESYFGFQRSIPLKGNSLATFQDKCLNAPVQSTSNDIVMGYVNACVDAFRKLGFGPDVFRVYMIRHDEAIFMVHKSALDYLYIVKDFNTIQVDDWSPLTMSLEIGNYYTIDKPELHKYFEGPKTEVFKTPRVNRYYPICVKNQIDMACVGSKMVLFNNFGTFETKEFTEEDGDLTIAYKNAVLDYCMKRCNKFVKVNVVVCTSKNDYKSNTMIRMYDFNHEGYEISFKESNTNLPERVVSYFTN